MFGLMRAHLCLQSTEAARERRLHYCGTCKTIGRLYGRQARFLLNHDAVLLAELLTALSPAAPGLSPWARAYRSYNCLSLPAATEIPLALRIAAASTLLLTQLKLADRIEDSGRSWKLVAALLDRDCTTAASELESLGFPVEAIRAWAAEQRGRETEVCSSAMERSPDWTIDRVAEPTSAITALVFGHAAYAIGANVASRQTMTALGFAFGTLVYLLDALDDYERDARRREFNAIRAAFHLDGSELPAAIHAEARAYLHELGARVERALLDLPLPPARARSFIARLRVNMARRLGEVGEGTTCSHLPPAAVRLSERWRTAVRRARSLSAADVSEQPASLAARAAMPFAFASVFAVAFISPQSAMAASSARECGQLAFNLIFLSVVARTLLTLPIRLVRPLLPAGLPRRVPPLHASADDRQTSGGITHSTGGHPTSQSITRVRRRRNPCDGCCIGCCDGCGDSCCDIACCECCSGGCDGAGCCCDLSTGCDSCCASGSCDPCAAGGCGCSPTI